MDWLDDIKHEFEAATGMDTPSDEAALKVLISTMEETKSQIKNQMILVDREEANLVKQIRKYDDSGGIIHWKYSVDATIKCLMVIHGYTLCMIDVFRTFNGVHPSAPNAVWMAIKVIFDNTPAVAKAERDDLVAGLDKNALENTKTCHDVKIITQRYGLVLKKLDEFKEELYNCIDDICQYMKKYDPASTSPNVRVKCANDTVKKMISDMAIIRRMIGV